MQVEYSFGLKIDQKCSICDKEESEVRYQFYRAYSTSCQLVLCIPCRQSRDTCPQTRCADKPKLRDHGLKTQFTKTYNDELMKQKKEVEFQLEVRNMVRNAHEDVRKEMNDGQNESIFDDFLEDLIELEHELKLASNGFNKEREQKLRKEIKEVKEKLANFIEKVRSKKRMEVEDETILKRLPPKLKEVKNSNVVKLACFDEHEYYKRRFLSGF